MNKKMHAKIHADCERRTLVIVELDQDSSPVYVTIRKPDEVVVCEGHFKVLPCKDHAEACKVEGVFYAQMMLHDHLMGGHDTKWYLCPMCK